MVAVLNAHYDGTKIVLDDPLAADLPINARLRVIVEPAEPCKAFAAIARMAVDAPELPRDYSENHDKYIRRRGME